MEDNTETSVNHEPNNTSLNLQDLAVTLRLLSVAIKRGAFEPNELSDVGNNYKKIEAFLKHQASLASANIDTRGEE